MDQAYLLIPLITGLLAGALIVYLLMRAQIESRTATLKERLRNREQEAERFEAMLEESKGSIAYLTEEKQAAVQHYSIEKAQNERVIFRLDCLESCIFMKTFVE